ncbi:hypothetical protein GCM10023350_13550 [Nocardioides endophyticus]|uniref:Uncharacterized protein n=1 Tax=Nocardioides endophyticus TaxID=1353775 RepID=A0ABP8YP43_9ACTN
MRRHLLDELDATRRASEALVLGRPAVRARQAALSQLSPVADGIEVGAVIEPAADRLSYVDPGPTVWSPGCARRSATTPSRGAATSLSSSYDGGSRRPVARFVPARMGT